MLRAQLAQEAQKAGASSGDTSGEEQDAGSDGEKGGPDSSKVRGAAL